VLQKLADFDDNSWTSLLLCIVRSSASGVQQTTLGCRSLPLASLRVDACSVQRPLLVALCDCRLIPIGRNIPHGVAVRTRYVRTYAAVSSTRAFGLAAFIDLHPADRRRLPGVTSQRRRQSGMRYAVGRSRYPSVYRPRKAPVAPPLLLSNHVRCDPTLGYVGTCSDGTQSGAGRPTGCGRYRQLWSCQASARSTAIVGDNCLTCTPFISPTAWTSHVVG
jgi:hypothetical protein